VYDELSIVFGPRLLLKISDSVIVYIYIYSRCNLIFTSKFFYLVWQTTIVFKTIVPVRLVDYWCDYNYETFNIVVMTACSIINCKSATRPRIRQLPHYGDHEDGEGTYGMAVVRKSCNQF
jgi:hypothetical protein